MRDAVFERQFRRIEVKRRELIDGGEIGVGQREQGFDARLAVGDDLAGGYVDLSLLRGLIEEAEGTRGRKWTIQRHRACL